MYCQHCGNQLDDAAKFCSGCGEPLRAGSSPGPAVDIQTPLMTAKPVFVPWVTLLAVVPFQIFFTIWGAGFFGGMTLVLGRAVGLEFPNWLPFVFFGGLAFFGIPFLSYTAKKKTYAKTEYKFYADRLEYAEGFWMAENKSIKYKNIIEANLRNGVIQKKYGLGSILLSTPATGMQSGRARSGIVIRDIERTEEIYQKLKQLID